MKRRTIIGTGGLCIATALIAACSLRDTSYLQAGGGTPPLDEGGNTPDTIAPGTDGAVGTHTATVVAANQFSPNFLVQDNDSLYWVTSDGNVMALKKDGSEQAPRTVIAAGTGVIALATADGAPLFYTKGDEIFTVAKAGGAATLIAKTTPPARALAVDSSFVFAMAEDEASDVEPTLNRFQHDGGAPTVLRTASDSLYMYAIALQGNDVFWDEGEGTFFSLPKSSPPDAGPSMYVGNGPGGTTESTLFANGFVLDDTSFFYSDGMNVRTHQRAPTSTATIAIAFPDVMTTINAVTAVAIDDRYVYGIVTEANGSLRRNTKDARGEPELMLTGLQTPNSLAVDATSIYIAVEGPPGAIVKTTK